jgi:hypothetical protein
MAVNLSNLVALINLLQSIMKTKQFSGLIKWQVDEMTKHLSDFNVFKQTEFHGQTSANRAKPGPSFQL